MYVKQEKQLSERTQGLRQICSLSPLLCNIYVENALRRWKQNCDEMGLHIGDAHFFTSNFADDQGVLAQDSFGVKFMLTRLRSLRCEI